MAVLKKIVKWLTIWFTFQGFSKPLPNSSTFKELKKYNKIQGFSRLLRPHTNPVKSIMVASRPFQIYKELFVALIHTDYSIVT